MNPRQNPFSLYDFLGYFVPGALGLYAGTILLAIVGDRAGCLEVPAVPAEYYPPFILAAYALGHFLSFLSSMTVEQYAIRTYGYPSLYLLSTEPGERPTGSRARLLRLVLWPVSILDVIVGRGLRLRRRYIANLDPLLREVVSDSVSHLLFRLIPERDDAQGAVAGNDYFRLLYHWALENCDAHVPKMQNYVALYGFLRTMCFLLVVIAWAFVASAVAQQSVIFCLLGLTASVVAYVFFMAFNKFYRRFSLEVFMAVCASRPTIVTRDK